MRQKRPANIADEAIKVVQGPGNFAQLTNFARATTYMADNFAQTTTI